MSHVTTVNNRCAHHSGFHHPYCPVLVNSSGRQRTESKDRHLGIMRDIGGGGMEKRVDAVPRVGPNRRAPIGAGNRFTINASRGPQYQVGTDSTCMIFPTSRMRAPGLQISIDLSRHSREVRISFADSSSILPTGYVPLTSPWKPEIQVLRWMHSEEKERATLIVYADVWARWSNLNCFTIVETHLD